nr:MAG TPA: leucine-rich repeat protein [Caudoviricetes sp.]
MAQKSSKQQAEEAVLDLKGKLRQLNNALAGKGATITENAPLVATIKAVEKMTAGGGGEKILIVKPAQFYGWKNETLPDLKLNDSPRQVDVSSSFLQNERLKRLPDVEGIGYAVKMSNYANGCIALLDVTLPALPEVKELDNAMRDCRLLKTATLGAAPKAVNISSLFASCARLESVTLDFSGGRVTNAGTAFSLCANLRTITGTIDLSNATSVAHAFLGCSSLEEVRIKGLKIDLDLSDCVKLSVESVRYLINNAQTVTGKRIDLSRALLDAHEEELGDLGDTASDKGWSINYK